VLGVAGDTDLLDWVVGVLLTQTDHLIVGVDNQLVDKLVEAGIDRDLVESETVVSMEVDLIIGGLNASDVGIGETEDMFAVCLLNVG
jgi:hypothetical protein